MQKTNGGSLSAVKAKNKSSRGRNVLSLSITKPVTFVAPILEELVAIIGRKYNRDPLDEVRVFYTHMVKIPKSYVANFKAPKPETPELAAVRSPPPAAHANPGEPAGTGQLNSVIKELSTLSDVLAGKSIKETPEGLEKFTAMMSRGLSESEHRMIIDSLVRHSLGLQGTGFYGFSYTLIQQAMVLNEEWLQIDRDLSLCMLEFKHDMLAKLPREEEAEEAINEAVSVAEETRAPYESLARICKKWGACTDRQMKYHEQEKALRHLLRAMRVTLGVEDPETANICLNLAHVLAQQEKYVEAEVWVHRFLYVVDGWDPESFVAGLQVLASILHHQGEYQLLVLAHQRLLREQEKVFGKERSETQRTRELLQITEDTDETDDSSDAPEL